MQLSAHSVLYSVVFSLRNRPWDPLTAIPVSLFVFFFFSLPFYSSSRPAVEPLLPPRSNDAAEPNSATGAAALAHTGSTEHPLGPAHPGGEPQRGSCRVDGSGPTLASECSARQHQPSTTAAPPAINSISSYQNMQAVARSCPEVAICWGSQNCGEQRHGKGV